MKYFKNWLDAKKLFGLILCIIFLFIYNVTSPPSSSLPQALPNVSVDANGKANLSIPISVPVGGPIVPNLILSYNSDAPNSFMGKGWTISGFESVNMNVTDNANLPEFSSSITGILVDISGNKTEYRAKNEIYAKVVPSNPADCGSSPCAWTIFTKDGIRYKFGSSANSRIYARGKPDVRQWLVDRVEDANGNGYNISYVIDNNAGFYYPNTITYIDRIIQFNLATRSDQIQEYSNNVGNGMNQIVVGISITAAGESFRDYTFNYAQGVDKVSLLNKVSQTGYKDIDISYSSNQNTIQPVAGVPANTNVDYRVPFFNQGKCQEVKNYCTCAAVSACWQPIVSASYGLIDPRQECAEGVASLGDLCTNGMQTGPISIMGDVTGDGKADIIKIVGGQDDNHIQVLRLNESGGTESSLSPQIKLRINSYISVADINGDGRLEVLYAEDNNQPLKVAYYDLATNSFSNIQPISNITVDTLGYDPNNLNLVSRNFTPDINGDRRTDFVSIYDEGANTRLRIFLSNGSGFQTGYDIVTPNLGTDNTQRFFMDTNGDGRPEWIQMQNDNPKEMKVSTLDLVAKTSNYITYPFDLSAGTVKTTNFKNISFVDVNADGKIDLAAVLNDGTVSVALFTENGFTAAQFSSLPNAAPQYLAMGDNTFQETQNTVAFSDVNGDRKDDLVYSKNGTLYISYSNGKGFTAHNDTKPLNGAFQLADITGNGKSDIIGMGLTEKPKTPIFQIQAFRIDSDTPVEYTGSATLVVQATNKEHKDLIQTVANNDGQTVNVSYTLNRDLPGVVTPNNGSYPNLPDLSAEHLVTSVVTDPGGSGSKSKITYEYADKKIRVWDNAISGDLGFKTIRKNNYTITNSGEVLDSSILLEFNQSSPQDIEPFRTTATNSVGNIAEFTLKNYATVSTSVGTLATRKQSELVSIYNNGDKLYTIRRNYYYDNFGNVNKEVIDNEGRIIEKVKTFSLEPSDWLMERVSTLTTKIDGQITENLTQSYTGLNVNAASREIQAGKWVTKTYEYDSVGNLTRSVDGSGKFTEYKYDIYGNIIFHKDSLGNETKSNFNSSTGNMLSETKSAGTTMKEYDSYGRLVSLKNPNSSTWSEQYIYSDLPNNTYIEKRINTTLPSSSFSFFPIALVGGSSETFTWSREYYKNSLITKREMSDSDGNIFIVDFQFDAFGRLSQFSNPYRVGETPKMRIYTYNESDRPSRIAQSGGNYFDFTYEHLDIKQRNSKGVITNVLSKNSFGELIQETKGQFKTNFEYDILGNVTKITDTEGGVTEYKYDSYGNLLSQKNPNTGKFEFEYDSDGAFIGVKDPRGIRKTLEYDSLGRAFKIKSNQETILEINYDGVIGSNTVSSLKGDFGEIKKYQDTKGIFVKTIHKIDDYAIEIEKGFDSQGRVSYIKYPEGTIAGYIYKGSMLSKILLTNKDYSIDEQTVIEFNKDDEHNKIIKKYGNNVTTEVLYDPIFHRTSNIKTTTARQSVEENLDYGRNFSGKIISINDKVKSKYNQNFKYDFAGRLKKSEGAFGQEDYSYALNGNLKKKGSWSFEYANPSMPHAVTKASSNNEIINFTYDAIGNVIKRNNDIFSYNSLGSLSSIQTEDGRIYNYLYGPEGYRLKKLDRSKSESTYYFGNGLFEISRSPGRPDFSTVYIYANGEIIAQWTRSDAILKNIESSTLPYYNFIGMDTGLNRKSYLELSLFFTSLALIFYLTDKKIYSNYVLSLSILTLLFLTCIGNKKKEFPFAALMASGGITSDTPSLGGNGSTSTGQTGGNTQLGGDGVSSAGTPISGMYFLHTNQLGSVTMITDAKGEMVSGMDLATGKSVIRYKPYGEIDRTNSDGPDIFRYKYTGQEEDRETGLYYYKARYYDPVLGRFLQADTVLDSEKSFGMNQYMYVGGDPISRKDPSGHSWLSAGKILGFKKFNKWWKGQMKFKDIKSISMNRLQISPRRQAGFLTPSSKNPCDESYSTSDAGPCFAIINAIKPFPPSRPGHSNPVDPLDIDWGDDGVPLHTNPRNCTPVDEEEYYCTGLWYENDPRDLPPFIEPDLDDVEYENLITLDPIPHRQDIYFLLHRDHVFSYGLGNIYWNLEDTHDDGIIARYFDPRQYPNDICQLKLDNCTGISRRIDTYFYKSNATNVLVYAENHTGFGYTIYNYYADRNGYISSYGKREPIELDPTSRRIYIDW